MPANQEQPSNGQQTASERLEQAKRLAVRHEELERIRADTGALYKQLDARGVLFKQKEQRQERKKNCNAQ